MQKPKPSLDPEYRNIAKYALPFPPTAPHLDGEPLLAQFVQELLPLDLLLAAHFVDVAYQDEIPLLFILPTENTRELMGWWQAESSPSQLQPLRGLDLHHDCIEGPWELGVSRRMGMGKLRQLLP